MRAKEFITESNQDELESQFEFNLDTDASRLEVYDMRGGPAGRIEFYNPNPDIPKQIGIDMIYVLPRYQRQGLGTAMFKYLTNRGFNILKPTELTPDGQEFFKNIKFKKQGVTEGTGNANTVTFFRGEPLLSSDRLQQLKSSIGSPYPIYRKPGSPANIGTYITNQKEAERYITQALAGKGNGGAVTQIKVDLNSFRNGDGGIDEAVIITNIAGLVSEKEPDSDDPLRISDRKQAMLKYLGPGVKKYLNDPLLNDPKLVKRWYDPEFAQGIWKTIKSGQQAVSRPGQNQTVERMKTVLGPLAEKIRRDPEIINHFTKYAGHDWVEYNLRMNSDGSGTRVVDVKYYPPASEQGVAEGSLNEIYKMPPTKDSSQGMTTWAYNDALEKKSPIIYRDNNVIIFKANKDLLRYIILQNGVPVLYIGLSKFLDGYKSGTVATEIAGRGKGLAQKAYLSASDILGVPIYSDTTQTDASRLGIWDKLIQQYPNRIVGYDQKTNKNLPLSLTDKGPTVNQNQPIYVDRNKKDTNKPIAPNQRYRTRILKLLPKKQGVAEGTKEINWVIPNFDREYEEVEFQMEHGKGKIPRDVLNYYTKYFPTKKEWLKAVQNGRPVTIPVKFDQEIRNNTENKKEWLKALSPQSHDPEGPEKKARVDRLFASGGNIEMPIILNTGKGLWMIGGKTRLGKARLDLGIPAKVWMIDGSQGLTKGEGFDQEAGIGIDGQSFKFKIKDLVDLAKSYPVTKVDPKQFANQIADREEDPSQSAARAEKADLQYPIIVVKRANGKLWIADGTHRAHKAILNKLPSINAKIIPVKDMAPFSTKQGVSEDVNNITYKQQKGKNKFSIEMFINGKSAGIFQYNANTGRTITELDPEFRGQGLGQRLILKGIYTAAMLGMEYVEDESRTEMFDRAMDSLADAGYIVNDNEYWYVTNQGEQFLNQIISEDQSIDNITIQNTVDDSFRGGYHGTLIARTPEQQIGYLQYSMYQGMPKISMIYVVPEFRRHRIANRLLKALQELAPDEEIDWGYTTNDGSALKRSIDFIRKPNPEIIKKKQKLAGVRSKLAQLNHKLEQLQATDIELARRYVKTVGDRWNKLNDLEYRLENELSVAKGEYSKLIPEDELEEGFKQTLANLGFAAAVGAGAVGGGAIKDKVSQFMNPPAATAQQTQQAPKAVQPAAPVAKKPVAPQITKINPITASPLEKKLILGAKQAGLKGVELAQFLAQCAHETLDYQRMIERGGKNYFNKYERKKILGNVKAGDGIKYKGRGYIQLTGRDNYMRAGRALGVDLINKPHLAADPDLAIKIALWYWNTRVKPDVTDFSNTTEVTKQINSGLKGLQQRHQNFVEYISQAQKAEPNPG